MGIVIKTLRSIEDFEILKPGDAVACEFHQNIHDYPKQPYRFGVFRIAFVKPHTKEVILQVKNNIYFNYKMFVKGESNLKNAMLIYTDET